MGLEETSQSGVGVTWPLSLPSAKIVYMGGVAHVLLSEHNQTAYLPFVLFKQWCLAVCMGHEGEWVIAGRREELLQ